MSNYPTSLDSFVNPTTNDFLNSPNHVSQHSDLNDAVEALEAKLGLTASTPANNKLLRGTGAGTSEWDKDAPSGTIVGTTDTQTLTNKTLTSPTINTAIINNPTLATDTIAEYTSAAGVTIDGLLIKDSKLATDNSVVTANITNDAVTDDKLDYPRWWQEIGRTTLSSSADTITVSSLPARRYLRIQFVLIATGGTVDGQVIFNLDTATNYTHRFANDQAADTTTTSAANVNIKSAAATMGMIDMQVLNISNQEKLFIAHGNIGSAAGAASAVTRREMAGKWANTSAQINSVRITNTGTGDYASGSEIVVLGHD